MFRPTVTQERLDFQLAPTRDTITGRAGLALFQEAALVLGVRKSIKENLPAPGSGHGFKPQEYVLPLVMMLCGGGRTMEDIREIELDKGLTNPFFAMDTGTIDESHKTAKSQAEMVREMGYAGIGYWERNPAGGTEGLREMLGELDKCGLKAYPVYFTIKLEEPNERYMPLIAESIKLLAGRETVVWLAITSDIYQKSSSAGDDKAVAIIRAIADLANKDGVGVALYPHAGFWLEKVDDAVRVADKANRRNVGVTFNLYHWLKTDKPANMEAAIKKAMPYLFAVTINGTTEAGSIEALDGGTFDVYKFLKVLKQEGFKGPIGLQGYGITGDVRENLRRSMEAWRRFSQRLATEEAEGLLEGLGYNL